MAPKPEQLIDTNVAFVADSPRPDECAASCVEVLRGFHQATSLLALDRGGEILREYLHNRQGNPNGAGDAFIMWACRNQGDPDRCRLVDIDPNHDRVWTEFPEDPDLLGFDRSDRKFVAVAIKLGSRPLIFNATDSDWRNYSTPLARYVNVIDLCPDQLKKSP
jgi:hypothetical protein